MSDIEEFTNELNNQNPVDLESLAEAFDTVFYEEPEGTNPVEAKHVSGFVISSPESTEELVDKLREAKKANPNHICIGEREYILDSKNSLSRLIDGILIGNENIGS